MKMNEKEAGEELGLDLPSDILIARELLQLTRQGLPLETAEELTGKKSPVSESNLMEFAYPGSEQEPLPEKYMQREPQSVQAPKKLMWNMLLQKLAQSNGR